MGEGRRKGRIEGTVIRKEGRMEVKKGEEGAMEEDTRANVA